MPKKNPNFDLIILTDLLLLIADNVIDAEFYILFGKVLIFLILLTHLLLLIQHIDR